MKSKKAKEYIDEWVFDAANLVDADGVGCAVIRRCDAVEAVERAEAEIREELLRWRDPIKEPPLSNGWVLIKIDKTSIYKYVVALYIDGKWEVLGRPISLKRCKWRPICEE